MRKAMWRLRTAWGIAGVLAVSQGIPAGDDPTAAARQFVVESHAPTGLLVPLYQYPANIHQNAAFNALIRLKLDHQRVPCCAIVNPASGPGQGDLDANYVKAIDRLIGAGIVVLGYVSTEYGRRSRDDVRADIIAWRARYPRATGLFFDEMGIAPRPGGDALELPQAYASHTRFGHEQGFWPVFANPGTDTPQVFFDQQSADVFVIHEGRETPADERLRGDYFGGYADYPPSTRGLLIYGRPKFDPDEFRNLAKRVRWVYVTDDELASPADNPWDTLSGHIEAMFQELDRRE